LSSRFERSPSAVKAVHDFDLEIYKKEALEQMDTEERDLGRHEIDALGVG
jgi:hypothetical protein